MPRLMGVDIPGKKRVEYSLRYIHGIGPARSAMILEKADLKDHGIRGLVSLSA